MICYIIQYEDYLRTFQVSDYATKEEAQERMKVLESATGPLAKNCALSAHFIEDVFSLRCFSSKMGRDVYNLMCEEGREAGPDEVISRDRLFARLESWMKE